MGVAADVPAIVVVVWRLPPDFGRRMTLCRFGGDGDYDYLRE